MRWDRLRSNRQGYTEPLEEWRLDIAGVPTDRRRRGLHLPAAGSLLGRNTAGVPTMRTTFKPGIGAGRRTASPGTHTDHL